VNAAAPSASGKRDGRLRLAVVASHPVQYQAPWYRALSARLDLRVFFAHRATAADQARAGFGVEFEWDTPLLEGYRFDWLENVARSPGVDRFLGCDTPGVRAALGDGDFDAVLVNGWHLRCYWQAVAAAKRFGMPVMVRGDSQLETPRGAFCKLVKRAVYPSMLRRFDTCLAVGRRSAEYYRSYGVPEERIVRSPHCVDNAFFHRAAEVARQAPASPRSGLGIPDDAVVFLFAGKLVEKKRPLDFLRALDLAGGRCPGVWGIVVGDGALKPDVDAHLARHGTRAVAAGFLNQPQLARTYAAADVLVLPSSGGETWGLVVNEAMAAGVTAIVSDQVGCAPDLIVEGKTGFTYPCGDVDALAGRMSLLAGAADLRRAMRRQAQAHVGSYSPEAAAAGVVCAMERLAHRSRDKREVEREHVVDVAS
jgi:glycosyltransferase involved in cell wall biosynthesis